MDYRQEQIYDTELEAAELKRSVALISELKLKPKKDGDQWCFLFGENFQSGIAGFGRTVHEAAQDFEYEFCYRTAQNINTTSKIKE